jgi:hypothetical protein
MQGLTVVEPNTQYEFYENLGREPDPDEQEWFRCEPYQQDWLLSSSPSRRSLHSRGRGEIASGTYRLYAYRKRWRDTHGLLKVQESGGSF